MRGKARRRGPRTVGPSLSGLAAGLVVALAAIVLLLLHSTVFEVGRFVAFNVVGVLLPGIGLWRLIGGYHRNLVEDCAAGFGVGTAAQIIVYLASASVGLQLWSWVWAPILLLVTVLDRDIRARVWRPVDEPLRPVQAWLLAAAVSVVVLVVYRRGPGQFLPAYTDPLRSYPDLAFQQAVAASAKYDVPISTLWLGGEPLKYHTFYHQATAATAWATRIDLTDLIHSLTWLPLLLAGLGMVYSLIQRFLLRDEDGLAAAGGTWAGPLAVLLAGLGGTLQVLPDHGLGGISMAVAAYLSPTQNLGVLLALILCVLAADLLRGQRPRSRWVLFVLITLVAAGAKSTILPLAGCGFAAAFLYLGATRRRTRPALLGGLVCLAVFIGALVVIFGGSTWGTEVRPFHTFVQLAPGGLSPVLTAVTTLLSWALAASGILFVGRRWSDPAAVFLLGFSAAGLLGASLTSQSGISQLYFLRTAFPVVAVLASVGLAGLVGRLPDPRRPVIVASAGSLGLVGCWLAREQASRDLLSTWLWVAGALVLVGLVVAIVWKLLRGGGSALGAFLAAVVAAAMVGALLVPLQAVVSDRASNLIYAKVSRGGASAAQAGAARWLRRNSEPGDLVATNAHCIIVYRNLCDSRHFWLAALSERRVLVEGWAYSNRANKIGLTTGANPSLLPYWNREQLAANDAAFTAPTPAVIERLRATGVRWLFADHRAGPVSDQLKQYVRLRHATLDVTIYEIR